MLKSVSAKPVKYPKICTEEYVNYGFCSVFPLFSMLGVVQFYLKKKNSDLLLSFIVMVLSWLAMIVGVAAWR